MSTSNFLASQDYLSAKFTVFRKVALKIYAEPHHKHDYIVNCAPTLYVPLDCSLRWSL